MNGRIPRPAPPSGRAPIRGAVPAAGGKPRTTTPEKTRWSFSFRYWNQIDKFGFGDLASVSDRWFVALLDRLHQMKYLTVDDVFEKQDVRDAMRFHAIDHKHEHTTMQRADFYWVDDVYLKDEPEYPVYQFHISKGLGRVVGFFDEKMVFNVLLLDPRHNLQLSKFSDYRTREARLLDSEHVFVRATIDKAIDHLHRNDTDGAKELLVRSKVDRSCHDGDARVVISIQETEVGLIEKTMREKRVSVRDIFEMGLCQLIDSVVDDKK